MLNTNGSMNNLPGPADEGLVDELADSREIQARLEDCFAWFLSAGDLQAAQAVQTVLSDFLADRETVLLSLVQTAQEAIAQAMLAEGQ